MSLLQIILMFSVFITLCLYTVYLRVALSLGNKVIQVYTVAYEELTNVAQLYWDELPEEKQVRLNRKFMAEWEEMRKKIEGAKDE